MWDLVRHTGILDLNSPYCYLLLFKDFSDTCVIAERDDEVVGFMTAYRPPQDPDLIFVWQIGVREAARGKGLGTAMLLSLLERPACSEIRYLEATVTPSNHNSFRLFQSLARRLGTQFKSESGFEEEHFPEGGHEVEHLIRIGPIDNPRQRNGEKSGSY